MARILIVGGGCRGRLLCERAVRDGHAVRVTTRSHANCAAIERAGGECWVGTPSRLATLRGALDRVAIVCWLLGRAQASSEELAELYGPRLELFMRQAIDTTVRGIVYESAGTVPVDLLGAGELRAREIAEANAIPFRAVDADPQGAGWVIAVEQAIGGLLGG